MKIVKIDNLTRLRNLTRLFLDNNFIESISGLDMMTNLEWLDTQLAAVDQGAYLMFDCPGQVELFTADSNI